MILLVSINNNLLRFYRVRVSTLFISMNLKDAETGERILVDTSAWSPDDWLGQRESTLRRSGALVSTIDTQEDPFKALMNHFRQVERLR